MATGTELEGGRYQQPMSTGALLAMTWGACSWFVNTFPAWRAVSPTPSFDTPRENARRKRKMGPWTAFAFCEFFRADVWLDFDGGGGKWGALLLRSLGPKRGAGRLLLDRRRLKGGRRGQGAPAGGGGSYASAALDRQDWGRRGGGARALVSHSPWRAIMALPRTSLVVESCRAEGKLGGMWSRGAGSHDKEAPSPHRA